MTHPLLASTTGDEVLAALLALEERLSQAGERRAVFCSAYVAMTQAVLEARGTGFFLDDAWMMDRLTVVFAHHYFRALIAWEQGRVEDVPDVWRTAFGASADQPVAHHLALSMAAHIIRDLPVALAEVIEPGQRRLRERDFKRLIRVIHRCIGAIRERVVTRYAPGFRLLDGRFVRFDTWGTMLIVWIHRRRSLREAYRLMDARDPAPHLARIERRAGQFAATVLRVPPTAAARRALAWAEQIPVPPGPLWRSLFTLFTRAVRA